LIKAIDLNNDGAIQYKEFERKLKRCGLRTLSKQELLMGNIVKVLRKTNRRPEDLFDIINKDGSGFASKQDFKDMLSNLGTKAEDIDNFIEYFYDDDGGKSGISLKAFISTFNRLEKQLNSDAAPKDGGAPTRTRRRVPRNIIERKQDIFR
jgi:Ca2+-binding EF-hand superfamily protein